MPKLKDALASHQAHQARLKAQSKASKVKEDKERSIKFGKHRKKSAGAGNDLGGGKRDVKVVETGGRSDHDGLDDRADTVDAANPAGPATKEIHRDGSTSTTADLPALGNKGKGKATARPTNPIDRDDTVLLLGEANFSFACALVSPPHSHPPRLVCATSYDSEETCYTKYPDARLNVSRLRDAGVKVGFGVDAGALEKSKGVVGKGKRWSKVIFNFPHVGAGIKDQERNILSNQHLVLRTFRSAAPLLTEGPVKVQDNKNDGKKRKRKRSDDDDSEDDNIVNEDIDDWEDANDYGADGEGDHGDDPDGSGSPAAEINAFMSPRKQGKLLITLLNQPPYTLWSLPRLGTKPPPLCPGTNLAQPVYILVRSFTFLPSIWPGYEHRRTLGFKVGVSKTGNEEIVGRKGEARTWEFALRVKEDE